MSTSTQISGNPRRKSRRTGSTELDRISNLPDCVMSHILSRLPTKEAVRTSVLSKDWEYKWTFSYNVELDDWVTFNSNEDFSDIDAELRKRKANFANFVDKTLRLSHHVQSFRLSCQNSSDSIRRQTWISAALSSNIHNLDINYREGGIVLPSNLLNCYSLRKLELNIVPSTLKVPAMICFPFLKFLDLNGVEIVNERVSSDVVKFSLPVLETFILKRCKWLNVKFVEIYAPKMTRFFSMTSCDAGISDYSFHFTGGCLVKVVTDGVLVENIILSGGSEVVSAELRGCYPEEDLIRLENNGIQIRKLMNGFLSLKELELSGRVAKAIALSKPRLSLPKYYKMERLVLHNTEIILELLHAAPFLKFMSLHVTTDRNNYDYDAVPSCIVSHLEEVKFYGSTRMLKLEKFILKNAVKLKGMYVSCTKIAEELSTYPQASTCLTIVGE